MRFCKNSRAISHSNMIILKYHLVSENCREKYYKITVFSFQKKKPKIWRRQSTRTTLKIIHFLNNLLVMFRIMVRKLTPKKNKTIIIKKKHYSSSINSKRFLYSYRVIHAGIYFTNYIRPHIINCLCVLFLTLLFNP